MPAPPRLRPHQKQALHALTEAFDAGERRATVVSACGTGKTHIAIAAAHQHAPHGRVLVLVPTLELLAQTAHRWHQARRPGLLATLSSATQPPTHHTDSLHLRTPQNLADHAAEPGPVTVVATYASLPKLDEAHQLGLPAWDLVIGDEAHRTCTDAHRGWGLVHDDHRIPAQRRLYLTATPRIHAGPAPTALTHYAQAAAPTATMDRRDLFGPIVFRLTLSEAIDRGLLADYQVVMPVIHDDDLHTALTKDPDTSPHHDGLRPAALQIARLRAITDHDLRRVLVFHNRTHAARSFSQTLPDTAAQAQAPLQQTDLISRWLSHTHTPAERSRALADFQHAPASAVLHNVRVLNEGIDIPAIDAVAFAAPRTSVVDAIQAIGRALRLLPGRKKKATLVIPFYLPRDGQLSGLDDTAYAPLIAILQALRAHDEHFLERLTHRPCTGRRQPGAYDEPYPSPERALEIALVLGLDVTLPACGSWRDGIAAATAYHAQTGHLDVPADHTTANGFALGEWITGQRLQHLSGRLGADRVATLNTLGMHWTSPRQSFTRMLRLARAFAARHGHLAAPTTERHGGHPLGTWLGHQRRKATVGTLHPQHRKQLEDIDPWWNPPWPLTWQRTYAAAKKHVADGGSTELPNRHRTVDGIPLGQWFSRQRNHFAQLHPLQARLLLDLHLVPSVDSLVPDAFRSERGRQFRRALIACAAYLAREGHLRVPRQHTEEDWAGSFPLGPWIHDARRAPQRFTSIERAALVVLQMQWSAAAPSN